MAAETGDWTAVTWAALMAVMTAERTDGEKAVKRVGTMAEM